MTESTDPKAQDKAAAGKTKCCQVCGKPGAAIRYRKFACNACRVFFSRAVQDSANIPCIKENRCVIHYLNIKKNCYACRLKKCHDTGMEATDVRKKGYFDRVVPRLTDYEWNAGMGYYVRNNVNRASRSLLTFQMGYGSVYNYVETLRSCEMSFLNGTFPAILSVNPLLNFPDSSIFKYISLLDYLSHSAFEPRGHYKVLKSTCRIMIASSELMCLVEEFKEMRTDDKEKLINNNARDLAILFPFLVMFDKPGSETSQLHRDSCALLDHHMAETCGELTTPLVLKLIMSIREVLEEARATTKDIHLLLLISLFQPSLDLSSEGYQLVMSACSRYSFILGCLIRDMSSGIDNSGVTTRLQQLMTVTRYAKEISSFIYSSTENKTSQRAETSQNLLYQSNFCT